MEYSVFICDLDERAETSRYRESMLSSQHNHFFPCHKWATTDSSILFSMYYLLNMNTFRLWVIHALFWAFVNSVVRVKRLEIVEPFFQLRLLHITFLAHIQCIFNAMGTSPLMSSKRYFKCTVIMVTHWVDYSANTSGLHTGYTIDLELVVFFNGFWMPKGMLLSLYSSFFIGDVKHEAMVRVYRCPILQRSHPSL